ncbi:hypothetical protein SCLCIDRAFT_1207458 [Scleroderma citrinum Foug A]|uniref:Uncharacterized protein n=1 Tax=Scleroderma citrinum Foug A TaxID=1036808 RepID=A0A0C3EQT4_9AGAM|nr:hypothetical protein SCLCIDRAFT_1207458 [Scleroderma citrinum Foug A]
MLARLSRQGNQWLSLHIERCLSSQGDGESFSVDLNLASLVSPPHLSWSHITRLYQCGIVPVYKSLRDTVEGDIERVSRLLSELEPLGAQGCEHEREHHLTTSVGDVVATDALSRPRSPPPKGSKRKLGRSSHLSESLVVYPSDPSAPIVVINPCPDECRETSSWVPYQDAHFGMRLTVPTHTPLNKTHPPLMAESTSPTRIENWQYVDGHWHAVIPLPVEQCRRGMYSRPTRARSQSRCLRVVEVEDSV